MFSSAVLLLLLLLTSFMSACLLQIWRDPSEGAEMGGHRWEMFSYLYFPMFLANNVLVALLCLLYMIHSEKKITMKLPRLKSKMITTSTMSRLEESDDEEEEVDQAAMARSYYDNLNPNFCYMEYSNEEAL